MKFALLATEKERSMCTTTAQMMSFLFLVQIVAKNWREKNDLHLAPPENTQGSQNETKMEGEAVPVARI
jgi:hypothetical protein